MHKRWFDSLAAAALVVCTAITAPTFTPLAAAEESQLKIVATTGILGDIARNVAGNNADVTTLIPPAADPHTFEPSLRTVRDIAYADVVFANGLLLEPQALSRTLNQVSRTPVVEVAELAATQGATLIPLVEDVTLDAVWLGLRARGATGDNVEFTLENTNGPGTVHAYIISTFGQPEQLFRNNGTTALPINAHTHVSWAFSAPGLYTLTFSAKELPSGRELSKQEVNIAVGVPAPSGKHVIDSGHIDITADFNAEGIVLSDGPQVYALKDSVLSVPSSALQLIPTDPAFRFLGRLGEEIYLLPQAVLGKHIHGEIDPHLWHDARNAMAIAEAMASELSKRAPSQGHQFHANAERYIAQLQAADEYMRNKVESIPEPQRKLVTTHHGYAYLEKPYGMKVGGFVSTNDGVAATPRDVLALRRTLENLDIPAVFVEPKPTSSTSTLTQLAAEQGVKVCPIYGDTLDSAVPTYLDLMRHNADSFAECLGSPRKH